MGEVRVGGEVPAERGLDDGRGVFAEAEDVGAGDGEDADFVDAFPGGVDGGAGVLAEDGGGGGEGVGLVEGWLPGWCECVDDGC